LDLHNLREKNIHLRLTGKFEFYPIQLPLLKQIQQRWRRAKKSKTHVQLDAAPEYAPIDDVQYILFLSFLQLDPLE